MSQGGEVGPAAPLSAGGNAGTWSATPTVAANRDDIGSAAAGHRTSHSGSPRPASSGATEVPSSSSGHGHGHEHGHGDKEKTGGLTMKGEGGGVGESKAEPVKKKVEELEAEGFVLVGFEDGDPEVCNTSSSSPRLLASTRWRGKRKGSGELLCKV